MWGFEIIVIAGMVALNGVFAAYEIALASIPLVRLQRLADDGRKGARAALSMKVGMEASLAVVQLGITLVGAIAAATGGAGADEVIAPRLQRAWGVPAGVAHAAAIALVVVPLTVVTIIFGELLPKVFALRNKEWVCLRLSALMQGFALAASPIVWVLETSVTLLMRLGESLWRRPRDAQTKGEAAELQELRASAAIARTSRLIGPQEERIILGATDLARQPVSDIMLPAEFISMLDVNSSVGEALVAAHLDMHTRFPVTERPGDPQAIIGYVNFKDIVAHTRFGPGTSSLRPLVRQVPSFPSDTPVSRCLQQLIQGRSHIALVRDPSGRVVGMVTLEDMLEELVGDIEDEYDRLPAHRVATAKGWIVGGALTLAELRIQTGVNIADEAAEAPAQTISDWIAGRVNGPIRGGEVVECPGARIVVRKTRRHKVLEAYVEPTNGTAPAAPSGPPL